MKTTVLLDVPGADRLVAPGKRFAAALFPIPQEDENGDTKTVRRGEASSRPRLHQRRATHHFVGAFDGMAGFLDLLGPADETVESPEAGQGAHHPGRAGVDPSPGQGRPGATRPTDWRDD